MGVQLHAQKHVQVGLRILSAVQWAPGLHDESIHWVAGQVAHILNRYLYNIDEVSCKSQRSINI